MFRHFDKATNEEKKLPEGHKLNAKTNNNCSEATKYNAVIANAKRSLDTRNRKLSLSNKLIMYINVGLLLLLHTGEGNFVFGSQLFFVLFRTSYWEVDPRQNAV